MKSDSPAAVPGPLQRLSRSPGFMILLAAFLLSSLAVLFMVRSALKDRKNLLEYYRKTSQFQAELIAERASSLFNAVDLTILSILPVLRESDGGSFQIPETSISAIRKKVMYLEQMTNLVLLDANGRLQWSLSAWPAPSFDPSDFLSAHRDKWLDLFVKGLSDGKTEGAPRIALSRRVSGSDGGFAGMLVAVIDPLSVYGQYSDYKSAAIDRVVLADMNGEILAIFPEERSVAQGQPMRRIFHVPLFESLSQADLIRGGLQTFQSDRAIGAVCQLKAFPFYMGVAYDKGSLLAPWTSALKREGIAIGSLILLVAGLMILAGRQISRRRRVEGELIQSQGQARLMQTLREKEILYRQMFETWKTIKLLIDPEDGRIVDANQAACEFYGFSKSDLIGKGISEIGALDVQQVRRAMHPSLSARSQSLTFSQKLATGEIREVEVYPGPLEYEGKDLLYLIIHDVTARRQMEEELIKARKMEAVGILAGGIAHDFNNLLAVILGNIELAAEYLPRASATAKMLSDARKGAERARDLAHTFLTLSAGMIPARKTASLGDVIAQAIRLTMAEAGKIACDVSGENPWPVKINREQMVEVFRRILMNAREAMPEGGTIRVHMENIPDGQPDEDHRDTAHPEGPFVKVTIDDPGIGILPEHIHRIFDPYFSTKEKSSQKGTGLGLTLAYAIVRQHQGHIEVTSAPGAGTRFEIILPAQIGSGGELLAEAVHHAPAAQPKP